MRPPFGRRIFWFGAIFVAILFPTMGKNNRLLAAASDALGADTPVSESSDESPGDTELLAGIEAFYQGEFDRAYALFKMAYAVNSELAPPGVTLALLHLRRNNWDGVYANLTRAVREHPTDPESWFQLGDLAVNQQRLVEAEMLLARGNEIFADLSASQREESVRQKYLKNESLALTARIAEANGDLPGAEKAMRELLVHDAENSSAHLSLGYLFFAQNRPDAAEGEFNEAHRLDAQHSPGWLTLGLLLVQAGRIPEAKALLADRFRVTESDTATLDAVIRLYLKWDRMEEAAALVETLPAGSVERRRLSGRLELYRGNFSRAESEYQRALFLTPNDAETILGFATALAGEPNEAKILQARDLAAATYKKSPDSQEAQALLGRTEFLLGRVERADDLLRPLLDGGGLHATTAFYLAELLWAEGDISLAIKLLDLALNQEENFPQRNEAEQLRREIEAP